MRPLNVKATSKLCNSLIKSCFSTNDSKELSLIKNQALHVLAQHRSLLQMINDEHYTQKCPAFFDASVGGHVRHAVDHFQRVVYVEEDKADQILNYDERKRDTLIETNKNEALAEIDIMSQMIPHLNLEQKVQVNFMGNEKTAETYTVKSSLERELSFASHHGIHHLATVKLIMSSLNYDFDKDNTIGMAPSTVKDKNSKK